MQKSEEPGTTMGIIMQDNTMNTAMRTQKVQVNAAGMKWQKQKENAKRQKRAKRETQCSKSERAVTLIGLMIECPLPACLADEGRH